MPKTLCECGYCTRFLSGLCGATENIFGGASFPQQITSVLWSRSWSRKEPELLARAGAGAGILKFRLQLLAPALAPGQTKVVCLIIIHIEKDQKIELSRYYFQKVMKNLLFHLKAVKTGTHKAQVGAGASSGAGARAGAETF
jgi:hypothetical protein